MSPVINLPLPLRSTPFREQPVPDDYGYSFDNICLEARRLGGEGLWAMESDDHMEL